MPFSGLRPDLQIQNTTQYVDTLSPGPTLQTNALYLEDDLAGIRSQIKSLLGTGHFYDPIFTTPSGKQRAVSQLNSSLDALESHPVLQRSSVLTTVTVPSGANFVILSQSGNQTPSLNAAIGPTTQGAVVALSSQSGTAFAANELSAVVGGDALNPKNLALIHNNANGQVIESGQQDIFALLQVEGGASDGSAFNDTSGGARLKLSFVIVNQATKTLVACPAADIGGMVINYSYQLRTSLLALPEQAFTGQGTFVDNIGSADITLTQATANQAGAGIPVNSPVLWRVATSQQFSIQSANGGSTYFSIAPSGSATAASIATSTFSIATQSPVTSTQGMTLAQGTQAINVGVTAGQIDSAGLALTSTGTNPLKLNSGAQVAFKDGYLAGSTWSSTAINLAASAAEYSQYKANFGEVSLIAGINAASFMSHHKVVVADVVGGIIPANTNLTGAGAGANLSVQFPDYSKATDIISQVRLIRNGQILRYGANAAAGQDFYPGTSPANGDFMLTTPVRGTTGGLHGDVLTCETWAL